MRGPKPPQIELSEQEREELEKLIKGHNTGQQIALRARIILAAGGGKNNSEIGRELAVGLDMVRLWRGRWLLLASIRLTDMSIKERLEDLPRPGAPARITADQRCQIEQLACEPPEDSARPISYWTGREIADEIKKRGIGEQISARHASRLLKRGGSQTASNPILADAGG